MGTIGSHTFGDFTVSVIDAMEDYVGLLKKIFDFDALRALMKKEGFKFLFDALSGGTNLMVAPRTKTLVMGPFARRVLVEELGAPVEYLQGATPLPDFGGYLRIEVQK